MSKFDPQLIETIRQRCDIVAVVSQHVKLRKIGSSYVGSCPFHSEKTPSFNVIEDKKFFHCFGCQQSGDVFHFLMQIEGISFLQALQRLARETAVELPHQDPKQQAEDKQKQHMHWVNGQLLLIFQEALQQNTGQIARHYLQHRKINPPQQQKFALGYGLSGPRFLEQLKQRHLSLNDLLSIGLMPSGQEDPQYHLMSDRLIFPIRNQQGLVIAFGGRSLQNNTDSAKYMLSKESLLFKKQLALYGIAEGHLAIRQHKMLFLTEGFLDVIAAHEAQLPQSVALLGCSLSTAHCLEIKKLAQEVCLWLDADNAGQKASMKAAEILLKSGFKVSSSPLPEKEDPASLLEKRGPQSLKLLAKQRQGVLEGLFSKYCQKKQQSTDEKLQASQIIAPLLLALPEGIEKELYSQRLSQFLEIATADLKKALKTMQPSPSASVAKEAKKETKKDLLPTQQKPSTQPEKTTAGLFNLKKQQIAPLEKELLILRELMLYPILRSKLPELCEYLMDDTARDIYQKLADAPELSLVALLEEQDITKAWVARFQNVKPLDVQPLEELERLANRTFLDALKSLQLQHINYALQEIIQSIEEAEANGQATYELLRRKDNLTTRKRALKTRAAMHYSTL